MTVKVGDASSVIERERLKVMDLVTTAGMLGSSRRFVEEGEAALKVIQRFEADAIGEVKRTLDLVTSLDELPVADSLEREIASCRAMLSSGAAFMMRTGLAGNPSMKGPADSIIAHFEKQVGYLAKPCALEVQTLLSERRIALEAARAKWWADLRGQLISAGRWVVPLAVAVIAWFKTR